MKSNIELSKSRELLDFLESLNRTDRTMHTAAFCLTNPSCGPKMAILALEEELELLTKELKEINAKIRDVKDQLESIQTNSLM